LKPLYRLIAFGRLQLERGHSALLLPALLGRSARLCRYFLPPSGDGIPRTKLTDECFAGRNFALLETTLFLARFFQLYNVRLAPDADVRPTLTVTLSPTTLPIIVTPR
jgi:hypothetical protein